MNGRLGFVGPPSLAALLALSAAVAAPGQQAPRKMSADILAKVASVLAGRRVAQPPPQTRGGALSELYWAEVRNVPVVVSSEGTGSSVVIIVRPNRQAYVITNHHVVDKPFTLKGQPTVALLFYDPVLKNQYFSYAGFFGCLKSPSNQTDWCQAVRNSTRLATVVLDDPTRDLALLSVGGAPAGVTGMPPADIQKLQPGDEVAIIGNPEYLLWSLTTGIVSAIRTNFPLGTGAGTMIQTQAPVNPGNSGGPLIGPDGKVAGVVFAGRVGSTVQAGGKAVVVPAPGLNYAIGINEVLMFVRGSIQ